MHSDADKQGTFGAPAEEVGDGGPAWSGPLPCRRSTDAPRDILDTLVHDLRTPLSAMTGWLEVLDAQVGNEDSSANRLTVKALAGLQRAMATQERMLNEVSRSLGLQEGSQGGAIKDECLVVPILKDLARRGLNGSLERVGQAIEDLPSVPRLRANASPARMNDVLSTLVHAIAQAGQVHECVFEADSSGLVVWVRGGARAPLSLRSLGSGVLDASAARSSDLALWAVWASRAALEQMGFELDARDEAGDLMFRLSRSDMPGASMGAVGEVGRMAQQGTMVQQGTMAHRGSGDGRRARLSPGRSSVRGAFPTFNGATAEGEVAAPAKVVNGHARSVWPRTVLVVDDQSDIRELLATWLSAHGIDVLTAASAEAARRLVDRGERLIDVALIDVRMPGEDGITLMRSLKDRIGMPGEGLMAVAMTAQPREPLMVDAARAGFVDVIGKPIRLDGLLDRLNALARDHLREGRQTQEH